MSKTQKGPQARIRALGSTLKNDCLLYSLESIRPYGRNLFQSIPARGGSFPSYLAFLQKTTTTLALYLLYDTAVFWNESRGVLLDVTVNKVAAISAWAGQSTSRLLSMSRFILHEELHPDPRQRLTTPVLLLVGGLAVERSRHIMCHSR